MRPSSKSVNGYFVDRAACARPPRRRQRGLLRAFLVAYSLCSLGCAAPPRLRVLAAYGSFDGANGLRRLAAHAGVDLAAPAGTAVLAPADGDVVSVDFDPRGCGLALQLAHASERYTVYCHLSKVLVREGDAVRRGDAIARVGDTGSAGEVAHLHWQLCRSPCPVGTRDGALQGTEDPLARLRGCFDPAHRPSGDTLVFTSPLPCAK